MEDTELFFMIITLMTHPDKFSCYEPLLYHRLITVLVICDFLALIGRAPQYLKPFLLLSEMKLQFQILNQLLRVRQNLDLMSIETPRMRFKVTMTLRSQLQLRRVHYQVQLAVKQIQRISLKLYAMFCYKFLSLQSRYPQTNNLMHSSLPFWSVQVKSPY